MANMDDMSSKDAAAKLGGGKKAAKKRLRMTISQLHDDTFLTEHHTDGEAESPRYSHADLDALKKHLDEHWGDVKGASNKVPKQPTSPVKPESDTYQPMDAK